MFAKIFDEVRERERERAGPAHGVLINHLSSRTCRQPLRWKRLVKDAGRVAATTSIGGSVPSLRVRARVVGLSAVAWEGEEVAASMSASAGGFSTLADRESVTIN